MIRAARGALAALAAVVAFWLVTSKCRLDWAIDCNLPASDNNIAEMERMNGGIWERVIIGDVAPQKNVAIANCSLLKVGLRDENITNQPRLSWRDYTRRFVRQVAFSLGEIRLSSARIPFYGNPGSYGEGRRGAKILEGDVYAGALDFDVWVSLSGVHRLSSDSLELVEANIRPQLNPIGFELLGNGVIRGVEKISADRCRNAECDGGGPENNRPDCYRSFVAFGLWLVAFGIGMAGFWYGVWRRANGLLFLVSLVAASFIAAIGAAMM